MVAAGRIMVGASEYTRGRAQPGWLAPPCPSSFRPRLAHHPSIRGPSARRGGAPPPFQGRRAERCLSGSRPRKAHHPSLLWSSARHGGAPAPPPFPRQAINTMTSLSVQRLREDHLISPAYISACHIPDAIQGTMKGTTPGNMDLHHTDVIREWQDMVHGACLIPILCGYAWLGAAPGH